MSLYDLDPNRYTTYGEAIETNGLVVRHDINGVGLVTRGLVWQLFDIFIDTASVDGISSSWSNAEASITTTWTDSQYGIYGEYTP
jgi:hypothetical protein